MSLYEYVLQNMNHSVIKSFKWSGDYGSVVGASWIVIIKEWTLLCPTGDLKQLYSSLQRTEGLFAFPICFIFSCL